MAEEATTDAVEEPAVENEKTPKKKSGVLMALFWGTLGMLFGAGGLLVPLLAPELLSFSSTTEAEQVQPVEEEELAKPAFVEFGEIVVNLNSDRLNRYLRLSITLLVKEAEAEEVQGLVEHQKAILKSWLLSYLSDVSMEDIRGRAGQNRLRRDIQDHFNTVLFRDGYDRIRDVLFQEFNVQ